MIHRWQRQTHGFEYAEYLKRVVPTPAEILFRSDPLELTDAASRSIRLRCDRALQPEQQFPPARQC